MNAHTAGHWWALACVLAVVALFCAVAWGGKACEWLTVRMELRHKRRSDRKAARKAARKRHPSRRVPGRFPDGDFLSDEEWRALGRIQMDSMITIPEPDEYRRQP